MPNSLPDLFHHRWSVPVLAALHRGGGGARFAELLSSTGASRESLSTTLDALLERGLVRHNPGYGHPLRPEYLVGQGKEQLAAACARYERAVGRLGVEDLAYRKWIAAVLRECAAEGNRFSSMQERLDGITPRALSDALSRLEEAGLIVRQVFASRPPVVAYGLARRGRVLARCVEELAAALG